MRLYLKHLLFLFVLCICSSAWAQQGKNPFDLEGRTPQQILEVDTTLITNPLEIEEPSVDYMEDLVNPFDVSHIPLQTKDVKQHNKFKPAKKKVKTPSSVFDFRFWVLVFSCILFAFLLSQAREKIFNLSRAIFNQNYLKILARDNNHGVSLLFLSLYLLFFFNVALFLFMLAGKFAGLSLSGKNFLLFLVGVLVVYLCKHVLLSLTGFIFPVSKATSTYSFSVVLYNALLGILLMVVNILVLLGPESFHSNFLYLGLIIIILFFLFRVLNGIILASKYVSSYFFHFFLYLCTCEIAPLLILYKFIAL